MRLGAIFPQTEIGADPAGVRDFAQAAEALGYEHLLVFDHVLGADGSKRDSWDRPYSHKDMFHEPFVMFGYLAGITEKIEMTTGVLILSQRQTVLVAKQAAEVDVLTGGRLRLGIGVGWNHVEYEALGENFHDRGKRYEEQVELLRALWTQDVVDFHGKYHQVTHAGISPLPVQRPIPVWMGAGGRATPYPTDRVLRRVARISDGYFPQFQPDEDGRATIAKLREFAKEAGRNPDSIGIEPRINFSDGNPEYWQDTANAWKEMEATHISVNTMRAGLTSPQAHIDAIQQFKEVVSG